MEPDKARLLKFYLWLSRPSGLTDLHQALQQLRDVELMHLLTDHSNKQAVTIAWAEYGRRHTTADINLSLVADTLEIAVRDVTFGATLGMG